jgi:hypothetical protein
VDGNRTVAAKTWPRGRSGCRGPGAKAARATTAATKPTYTAATAKATYTAAAAAETGTAAGADTAAATHAAPDMGTAATAAATSAASGSRVSRARKQDRHTDNGQEFKFWHNTLFKRPAHQEAAQNDAEPNAHSAPWFQKCPHHLQKCSTNSPRIDML